MRTAPAHGSRIGREVHARHAFTLVEVLVALGLVMALAAGMYSFVTAMSARQGRIAEEVRRSGGVSALFDQLEADLQTCVAQDARLGSGVRGTGEALAVVSRGVGLSTEAALGDARLTEYAFGGGVVNAARREGQGVAQSQPICEGVERLRFRYYDGKAWRESFDSAGAGSLPVAIEVAVWFVGSGPARREDASSRGPADPAGAEGAGEVGTEEDMLEPETFEPLEEDSERPPDRVRLIVVPDGPVVGMKSSEAS